MDNKCSYSEHDIVNQSLAGDVHKKSDCALVTKPDPEEPEEEIDARTDENQITRKDVKLCNGEIFFIERVSQCLVIFQL